MRQNLFVIFVLTPKSASHPKRLDSSPLGSLVREEPNALAAILFLPSLNAVAIYDTIARGGSDGLRQTRPGEGQTPETRHPAPTLSLDYSCDSCNPDPDTSPRVRGCWVLPSDSVWMDRTGAN